MVTLDSESQATFQTGGGIHFRSVSLPYDIRGSVKMPSPFPGMDPFLEDPSIWRSVHHLLISQIGTMLNRLLPPRYVAAFGERVYVAGPDRDIYPAVLVKEGSKADSEISSAGGAATTAISDPPWVIAMTSDEVTESFVEIRTPGDDQKVATTIEVLSPRNKTAGSEGRQLYRQKQREVLASDTHLMEIDLLRSGEHTVAVPRDLLLRRGAYHYLVSLSRGNRRHQCEVWGIPLTSSLPRVRVPLCDPDPDVILDLQQVFGHVYEAGAFGRVVDYTRPPTVTLSKNDAEWSHGVLQHSARFE